jgi:hypothetical protein
MKRLAVLVVSGCMLQVASFGADITPGYTFSSGEANVTHTKLNNASAGTINTSFYSGKGSAGTDPNTAFTLLIHNTTLDSYQKMPISSLLDHASLLSSRTATTAPAVDDLVLVYDASAGAYRSMTWSNWLFGGTATSAPTNDTRFPVLHGGVPSSLTLSNLLGGLTSHALPTNGDALMVLTANGRAVKQVALESVVKDQTAATNWGNYQSVAWDGTRLRTAYETNKIDGLSATNTTLLTNDALVTLQAGVLKKMFLNELRQWVQLRNVSFAANTNVNTLNPAGAWVQLSSFQAAITPRATSSKVLVTAMLNVDVDTNPAHFRIMRAGTAIGLGAGSGSRTVAGASIDNGAMVAVTLQWLDSPATTSSTTYTVECLQSSGSVYIGRSAGDANNADSGRTPMTMMLEEIIQ